MPKKNIFISHSTKNDDQVDRIAQTLEDAGFEVWVDHRNGIEPGMPSWDKAIRQAIDIADAGLFVMSEESLNSDICGSECLLVRELEDPLYILKLEDVNPVNIWLYIKQIQYADISTDYDAGMNSLIRALDGETDADTPTAIRSKFTGESTLRLYLPYLFVNPMHGRDADLDRLTSSLNGVVQVTGTGGLGKSRLVAEVALRHEVGAVWHRCSSLSSPAELLGLLMRHFRLGNDSSEADVLQQLRLRQGTLIVIDNAEDVSADMQNRYKTLIAKLQTAGAHIVLTSRVRWEFRPLKEITPSALSLDHATAIAIDFAEAEDTELSQEDAEALAQASRSYPRLIEWAVGQLNQRPLRRVLKQLNDLTSRGVQDALYEMINRSLEQMTEQEGDHAQRLLSRLLVCVGTFDDDAVLALKPEDMDEDDMDDALDVLMAWRFVRYDKSDERYSLDEMVRLALPAPDKTAQQAHFEHYHSLHSDYNTNQSYNEAGEYARHALLSDDWDNIIGAMEWGFQHEAEKAVDWVDSVQHFMYLQHNNEERFELLGQALASAKASDYQWGQANTLIALGDVHLAKAEYKEAVGRYRQALTLFETTKDRIGQANTLRALGEVHYMRDEYDEAVGRYREALPLYEITNNTIGQANILQALGDVHLAKAEYKEAIGRYRQALSLFETLNQQLGRANILKRLGDVHLAKAEYDEAIDPYAQALSLYETMNNRLGQANTLIALGDVYYTRDEYAEAVQTYQKALTIGQAIGDFPSQLNSLLGLAQAYQAQDDMDNACRYARALLALAESHPFFKTHQQVQRWRDGFASWGCEGV